MKNSIAFIKLVMRLVEVMISSFDFFIANCGFIEAHLKNSVAFIKLVFINWCKVMISSLVLETTL